MMTLKNAILVVAIIFVIYILWVAFTTRMK